MSSRLTRLTGITAGTLVSGGLLLGGAAPAFADNNNNTNNNNATVTVTAPNTQTNTATVTQSGTASANSNTQTASGASGTNLNSADVTNISTIKQTNKNKFSFKLRQRGS